MYALIINRYMCHIFERSRPTRQWSRVQLRHLSQWKTPRTWRWRVTVYIYYKNLGAEQIIQYRISSLLEVQNQTGIFSLLTWILGKEQLQYIKTNRSLCASNTNNKSIIIVCTIKYGKISCSPLYIYSTLLATAPLLFHLHNHAPPQQRGGSVARKGAPRPSSGWLSYKIVLIMTIFHFTFKIY